MTHTDFQNETFISTRTMLGRCPQCKTKVRVDIQFQITNYHTAHAHSRRVKVLTPNVIYSTNGAFLLCPEGCTTRFKVKPLVGTLNASKPCNSRCTGAVGPACDCSCGGANHGGDNYRFM